MALRFTGGSDNVSTTSGVTIVKPSSSSCAKLQSLTLWPNLTLSPSWCWFTRNGRRHYKLVKTWDHQSGLIFFNKKVCNFFNCKKWSGHLLAAVWLSQSEPEEKPVIYPHPVSLDTARSPFYSVWIKRLLLHIALN